MPTYPGGKSGAGVYQQLINLMPPHDVYIEAFLGDGAVMKHKRPARRSYGIEKDPAALARWRGDEVPALKLIEGDALEVLSSRAWNWQGGRTLVYCDPPYLMSTRLQHRQIYRCEFATEDEHIKLLELLMNLPCMVMLSGYESELYKNLIGHWKRGQFRAYDRAGKLTTETIWTNYPRPLELHDYRFLGATFRERERIKRKRARWKAKLEKMPTLERQAILAAVEEMMIAHRQN